MKNEETFNKPHIDESLTIPRITPPLLQEHHTIAKHTSQLQNTTFYNNE